MLVVVGWRMSIEQALDELAVPHATLVEEEKWTEAVNSSSAGCSLVSVGDCRDVEQLLAAVSRAGLTSAVTNVYSWHEFYQVAAATLAAAFGVRPLVSPEIALLFRDKHLQKRALTDAGIATARSEPLGAASAARSANLGRLQPPLVLKPSLDASTTLTQRLEHLSELDAFLGRAETLRPTLFHAEEFVDGKELHADGVIRQGRFQVLAISRYTANMLEIREGVTVGSVFLNPTRHAETYAELQPFVSKVLGALGMTDGVFHLELFETAGGFIVGECASRPGGAMIVQTVRRAFGTDLWAEHVRAALSVPTLPRTVGPKGALGWVNLPAPQGLVLQMPDGDEVMARPNVVEVEMRVAVGQSMGDMKSSTHIRAGNAVLEADDDDEIVTAMEDLIAWFANQVTVTPLPSGGS